MAGLFGWSQAASALRVSVAGRPLDLTGHLEVREVFEIDGAPPSDHTLEQLWLSLQFPLRDGLAFESTLVTQHGGTATKADRGGMYSLDEVFESVSPSVEFEEAFLELRLPDTVLRLGKQKFAWGKLDRSQPNDVLNPERYADLFMQEEDERKIGVPAVQADYYLPRHERLPEETRVTAVWIPQYVPFRLPLSGERWFPPAAVSASTFAVPPGLFELPDGTANPGLSVPVAFATRNVASPAFRLANSGYAARVSALVGGVDSALYYYHGFDAQPAFQLAARAFSQADPMAPLGLRLSARTELTPVFSTVDAWGADAAYAWGRFTFRGEGAYVNGRPFVRDLRFLVDDPRSLVPQIRAALAAFQTGIRSVPIDLGAAFVERDAVEWGFGFDYSRSGYLLLLQVNQTDVLDNRVDLLIEDVETRVLANLRKSFWRDDLTAQLIGTHGIESDYTALLPRVTYRLWQGLEARVGYLFVAGRASSLVGQYKRNDQAFVRLRYLF